ncbi:hypothetical protein [Paenibacillus albus]|uniref:Uncharacterized protein n=1 Tax=Paenibacillus albus TaxID=2495582 RepID=A0A3S8ZYH0_9BACL|nr:hypothetical protein [Paenibacillus albus]AZN38543.1 hypothetical protein EJC50_01795 [Paenibacillus albus]
MGFKLLKTGFVAISAAALLLQTQAPGLRPNIVEAAASNQYVYLNSTSTLSVQSANLLMQDKGLVLAFTATITNNGSQEMDLTDYWIKAIGKGGKVFKTTISDADKNKKSLAPKSSTNITYFSVVDNQTKLSDISLNIIKWDFTSSTYERKLGSIKAQSSATATAAPNQSKVMVVNNGKVKGHVTQSYVTQDQNYVYVTTSFLVENVGSSSVKLSGLNFSVQTDSYSVYDVNNSSLTDVTLQPNDQKTVTMQTKLPKAVYGKSVTLVVSTKDDPDQVNLPIGAFRTSALNAGGGSNVDKTGKVVAYQPMVMLLNNTKVKGALKQSFVTTDRNNVYVTTSFLLENVGSNSLKLSNLGLTLQTDSYSEFDVNTSSLADVTLQPKERKVITLHTILPITIAGKNVSLIVASKDAQTQASFQIGAFRLPTLAAAPAVEYGKSKVVYIDGQPINTTMNSSVIDQNDDNANMTIDFSVENNGDSSMAEPALEFSLKTKNNVSYPLDYEKEQNGQLLPGIEKSYVLTGELPSNIDLSTSQLVVKTAATSSDPAYIVSTYKVKSTNQQGNVGTSFTYDTDYQVKLNNIQRSALSDSDMLVADLTITNKSNTAKKVPSLSGYFLVDGVKVDTNSAAVGLDQIINIPANGTYNMVVYTKIPYTSTVKSISFVLTKPQQDKAAINLFRFSSQGVSAIPVYNNATSYVTKDIGRSSSVKLLQSSIFSDDTNNYFYTELEATNLETRSALLSNLGGYLQDDSGQIAPLEITEVKDKILPNGKVLLSASGKMTSSFNSKNYKLVLGEKLPADTNSTGQTTEYVTVKQVAYPMNNTASVAKTNFQDLNVSVYNLNMRNIFAVMDVSGNLQPDGVKLQLDYDLKVNNPYDVVAGKHKLMFEFVDQDIAKATYTKEYSFITAENGGEALSEGTSIPLTVVFQDPNFTDKVQSYKNYKLNIYDVYGDAKRLIASKNLQWFTKDNG